MCLIKPHIGYKAKYDFAREWVPFYYVFLVLDAALSLIYAYVLFGYAYKSVQVSFIYKRVLMGYFFSFYYINRVLYFESKSYLAIKITNFFSFFVSKETIHLKPAYLLKNTNT